MICPLCGSSEILRVHGGRGPGLYPGVHFRREGSSLDARRFEIIPRKLLGIRFYSCLDCDWRGTELTGYLENIEGA